MHIEFDISQEVGCLVVTVTGQRGMPIPSHGTHEVLCPLADPIRLPALGGIHDRDERR